ncbi:stage II sporulation protein R [Paenibacillus sp. NEAU-GSW1]|uniref:stage II sporulation protein R n=1 Tax=Paenibacillus sp. NEAU-GSW1 TaxID=2682486 RepID=UPI0012E30F50|nr:stage II sporulation protein R [Paenibacillus sp. NEAU-GSW1]MUT65103.1 stage II sporulation protein R [Paenibacillus sp. NEAU-GSW1]
MSRNHSRFSYRKSYGYIIFVLIMLIMSWELQQMDAAVASGQIPQESIRLRILANSDAPADQAVKRVVRDAVVDAMNNWVTGPQTIEEARVTMQSHMGEIEAIVGDVLESRGFDYSYSAQLGMVPFPAKMYGGDVYPAGEYEALLITLGEGKGQNWWCVLFPPLCFVDAATGEAAPADEAALASADAASDKTAKSAQSPDQTDAKLVKADKKQAESGSKAADADKAEGEAPEAKFFLWEMLQKLGAWLKGLFA